MQEAKCENKNKMKTNKQIIIDTNKDPKIPYKTWKIEEHIKGGKLIWNPDDIILYLESEQKESYLKGDVLRERLKGKPTLNASVLDFLLGNPSLIPDNWKEKYVYFWGTIYRDSLGDLFVHYLYFYDGEWCSDYRWLDDGWDGSDPAALRASSPLSSDSLSSLNLRILSLEKKFEKLEKVKGRRRKHGN